MHCIFGDKTVCLNLNTFKGGNDLRPLISNTFI